MVPRFVEYYMGDRSGPLSDCEQGRVDGMWHNDILPFGYSMGDMAMNSGASHLTCLADLHEKSPTNQTRNAFNVALLDAEPVMRDAFPSNGKYIIPSLLCLYGLTVAVLKGNGKCLDVKDHCCQKDGSIDHATINKCICAIGSREHSLAWEHFFDSTGLMLSSASLLGLCLYQPSDITDFCGNTVPVCPIVDLGDQGDLLRESVEANTYLLALCPSIFAGLSYLISTSISAQHSSTVEERIKIIEKRYGSLVRFILKRMK